MKVFLTGATGYIGGAVADRLLGGGHEVLGLARSGEAAESLRGRGIEVHPGELGDLESLVRGAEVADGVINAGTGEAPGKDRGQTEHDAVAAMLGALEGTGKPLVYTSDQLIYGTSGDGVLDEDSPLDPPPFLAWRPEVEKLVLEAAENRAVRGIVVRSVAVYGRGGGQLLPMLIEGARQAGVATYVGSGEARWSTIHVEDLAEVFVRALEQAPAGTLVNASAGAASMEEQAEGVSLAAGLDGSAVSMPLEQAREVMGPFADNFVSNLVVSGERARQLLDWEPECPPVFEDLAHGSYQNTRQKGA